MSSRAYRVARVCLRSSQTGAVLLLLAPLAYRVGLADLRLAFGSLALGLLVCVVTLAVAVTMWLVSRQQPDVVREARMSTVLSVLVLALPLSIVVSNLDAPPIHHITTDREDPPRFDAVVPLRGDNSNPLEYPGDDVWVLQQAAYPDLRPLQVDAAPSAVFAEALQVVENLGWELVSASDDDRRIEATDTTGWFGFKDDIVIRIRPDGDGSRVDLRSVSRVGRGDLGANAARIRAFISALSPKP